MQKITILVLSLMFLTGCVSQTSVVENTQEKSENTRPITIVAMGDSLTEGLGIEEKSNTYPAQLEKKLQESGRFVKIENAGVSGETTNGGKNRIDWILEDSPDGIILFLGANDMLRGISPDETKKNLEEIIIAIQAKNIPLMLLPMKAQQSMGKKYQQEFDALYFELSQEKNVPIGNFPLENIALVPKYNLEDGIHPNAKGYALLVENIYEDVENFVDTAVGTSKK